MACKIEYYKNDIPASPTNIRSFSKRRNMVLCHCLTKDVTDLNKLVKQLLATV